MKRRQVLKSVGVGSVGVGALVGTGGYSLVRSQRRVRIDVGEKDGDCVDCTQGGDAGRLSSLTIENLGAEKHIVVEDRGPGGGNNVVLFDGSVPENGQFTVEPRTSGPPNLRFYIDGSSTPMPVRHPEDAEDQDDFHVSCSKTIQVGQYLHPDDSPGNELRIVSAIDNAGNPIC